MKLKCLVVDDEPDNVELIKMYIEKIPFLELTNTCNNAFEALEILQTQEINLLLTDIEMPGINGMQLVQSIINPPLVILITAHRNYALESFDLNVVDYLLKPVSFERFLKAVNKAKLTFEQKQTKLVQIIEEKIEQEYLFIPENGRLTKIFVDDILYVKALRDNALIATKNNKIIAKIRMKDVINKLPADDRFLLVHKSYFVRLSEIVTVFSNSVEMSNKDTIDIARERQKELNQRLGI